MPIARENAGALRPTRPTGIPQVVWARLGIAYLALGVIAWLIEPSTGPDDWWRHGLWCLAGIAVAALVVAKMFVVPFSVVLVEHRLMFLASFALYFLFGAALLAVGPESELEASLRYYPITAADAMRVNAINGFGFGLALMTSWLARGRLLGICAARSASLLDNVPIHLVIGLFLAIGGVSYIYVLSFDIGFHDGVVPGFIRALRNLSLVAIFLAAAYRGKGEAWFRAMAVLMAVAYAIGGTLQFNKTEVLVGIAAFVAGSALRFTSRWILPVGVIVLVVVYVLLGSIIAPGRLAIAYEGVRTLSERLEVVRDELERVQDDIASAPRGSWSRLSYTVPQAAALDFWDAGQGGDGFELLGWSLIPRFLDQDKPEMTKTGREFHEKITGSAHASYTGQGIFASGYYHGGWLGFIFASIVCGWIIAQTSAIAREIVEAGALLLSPFSLLGLYIAFRIDGDFVSDYVGAFVFIMYPIVALSLASIAMRADHPRAPKLTA